MRSNTSAFTSLATLAFMTGGSVAGGQATFTPLGDLPGGDFGSYARSISNDGSVIVGQSVDSPQTERPFRWSSETGMIAMGPPKGWPNYSNGLTISGNGEIIGGSGINNDGLKSEFAAIIWDAQLNATGFDHLFEWSSWMFGASYDGSVLVGADKLGGDIDPLSYSGQAFRYQPESKTLELLPDLPGNIGVFDNCCAFDVTANGAVPVGFATDSSGIHAVRWTNHGGGYEVEVLGALPNSMGNSSATVVSHNGMFIVGHAATNLGVQPFRWSAATGMQALGIPPQDLFNGKCGAVSADGQIIVGGWAGGLFPWHEASGEAFVWTPETGVKTLKEILESQYGLDLTGWQLNFASDLTPDGRVIIGTGFNPQGKLEGWKVELFPLIKGDANADQSVNVDDLLQVINNWGPCGQPWIPGDCSGDLSPVPVGNGVVDVDDLLVVINNWS